MTFGLHCFASAKPASTLCTQLNRSVPTLTLFARNDDFHNTKLYNSEILSTIVAVFSTILFNFAKINIYTIMLICKIYRYIEV